MAKTLVVVESPTKAKTLERYLGPRYTVKASYGHIRDLPKSEMGVDTENTFTPTYVIPETSKKAVTALKSAYRKADGLVLATDFDREGEAIAFHVATVLGIEPSDAKRVTFTEITKSAVLSAFEHPRPLDMQLVEAQQARRIMDRLVGYNISPILWKKVRRGLSAGRVQSVALRLIVDREREIRAFTPKEYWSVEVSLTPDDKEHVFVAKVVQIGDEKLAASPDKNGLVLATQEEAAMHAERLWSASYVVADVREKQVKRTPAPPFTTSTLQQEAARKLGFSARQTMRLAQQLYEGVEIPGEGQVGLITYMRTDSVQVAAQALTEIGEVVRSEYGAPYALKTPRRYKKKQRGAQEAHEAIRPTSAKRLPDQVAPHLEERQAKLYRLIWQRTVASQMAQAVFDQVSVDIEATPSGDTAPPYRLRATGQTIRFDGFRRVYFEGHDEAEADDDSESTLPSLAAAQPLRLLEVLPEQHFTQPPPRFSEASLVKTLEELGIGRPSTYASIISTLVDRGYVRIEDRRFYPEDVGEVVTDLMVEHFPEIVDVNFTARMEEELDEIAEGKLGWVQVLDEFYGPFERLLEKKEEEIERFSEKLDEACPKCAAEGRVGGTQVVKLGRYGKFVSCSNYPECDYRRNLGEEARPEPEVLDERCPECGRSLVSRVGRFGPFIGCSGYPECRYIKKQEKKTGVSCPECGRGDLVVKRTRKGKVFYGCNRYPDCSFAVWSPPVAEPCPSCGSVMVKQKTGIKCSRCDTTLPPPDASGQGSAPAEEDREG